MSKLVLNSLDFTRIQKCISDAKQFNSVNINEVNRLVRELRAAKVVESKEIPADIVTMNSIVKLTFISNKQQTQFQIVYPQNADLKENKISIFSPIATAIIGYKVGDQIEWEVPAGPTKIKIDKIIYQPEAAGDFEL